MTSGGPRAEAGRPKGSKTTKTRDIAVRAAAEGISPVEFMLNIMRDESADMERREAMAKACAPFCHPRLAYTTVKQTEKSPTPDELKPPGPAP